MKILPSAAASSSARSTRSRNRCVAARSASSGSTLTRRATLTAANSTSPSSSKTCGFASTSGAGSPPACVDRLLQLAQLVVEIRRAHRRRPGTRTSIAAARRWTFRAKSSDGRLSGTSWKIPSRPSWSRLICLPVRAHAAGASPPRPRRTRADDGARACAWIAASHDLEVAVTGFLEQQREEVHLEEQVTELVGELRVVTGDRRVGDLVRLLQRVRHDRARSLLAVPRAVAAQVAGSVPAGRAGPPRGRPSLR